MGLIPKQTKAENKAFMGLSMKNIYGLIITIILSGTLGQSIVHTKLIILFYICNIAIFLWLNTADPIYPKRTLWKGIVLWLQSRMKPKYYRSLIGNTFLKSYKESQLERIDKNGKSKKDKANTHSIIE